jgi:predicted DNA-binding protein with PD1-like motif
MRILVLPALALLLTAGAALAQPQPAQPQASPAPLPRGYTAFGAPPRVGPSPGLSVKAFASAGRTTYKLSFKAGDDIMGGMMRFAAAHPMQQAQLSGVGGVRGAVLAWYDPRARAFKQIPVNEKCEISGVTGTITKDAQGRPNVHLHLVLSRSDGSTVSGHLLAATVDPVLEVFVTDLGAGKDIKVPPEGPE